MAAAAEYDARYLAGVSAFNRGDYFAAHEEWEEVWLGCASADRLFYQSLIQAAVSLYHWGNGNRAGARRLFGSGRGKMAGYRPSHLGLDVDGFWRQVEAALAGALADDPAAAPAAGPAPQIVLAPTDATPSGGSDHDR